MIRALINISNNCECIDNRNPNKNSIPFVYFEYKVDYEIDTYAGAYMIKCNRENWRWNREKWEKCVIAQDNGSVMQKGNDEGNKLYVSLDAQK